MSEKSDTPRSDARLAKVGGPYGWYDLAQDLERERDEARKLVKHWMPIETAPQDGTEIIVYCPPSHGLNHMVGVCSWHEDAGFCVDELREPILWIPLPNL